MQNSYQLLFLKQIPSSISVVSITNRFSQLNSTYLKFCASISVFAATCRAHQWSIYKGLLMPWTHSFLSFTYKKFSRFIILHFLFSFSIIWQQIEHQLACILEVSPTFKVRDSFQLHQNIYGTWERCVYRWLKAEMPSSPPGWHQFTTNANKMNVRMCFWMSSRMMEWGFPLLK